MPLQTTIERDGKALTLRWGGFHVAAMVLAASWESGIGPFEDNRDPRDREGGVKRRDDTVIDYPLEPYPIGGRDSFDLMADHVIAATPLNNGEVTLKREHRFIDCADGELLELMPGDVLRAWRS